MLWVLLLSVWSSAILFLTRRRAREIAPYATAVLLGLAAFFCGLLIFLETPFARASPVPAEGLGLNPLLRHPAMMFHPPMLYSGYTLFTIPFAFAVGALITRRLDADWLRTTRPFALAAWLCLGVGIVLGARWSYSELGWGGYWGWDAVENASLMPWLIGTAFLHSAIVQEKRGMLRMWNVSLILGAGILAILGTFLVRSGILESIHAFGASTLGIPFLVLIAVLTLGSALLVISRAPTLRSERRLDSLLSREAIFLLNNLALVGLCFVILWGTFFPLISEAFTGTKSSVGPPWFSRYVTPLALVLVLLSGLGPALAWRRTTAANLRRTLLVPTAVGAIVLVVLLAVGGVADRPAALAMFAFGAFVLAVVVQEFWRGIRARQAMSSDSAPRAFVSLVRRNRRRYGGYIVHAGVTVLLVGVAASSSFQDVTEVRLAPGESARVGGYDIQYARATGDLDVTSKRLAGEDQPRRGPARAARRRNKRLHTERSFFPSNDPQHGRGVTLLRGRGDERGGPAFERRRTTCGRWWRRTPRRCGRRSGAATRCSSRPRSLPAAGARGGARRDTAPPRRALPAGPPAGAVPRARLAARGLGLGGRADRVRRRADHALAVRGGGAPGGDRRLRGAARAGPAPSLIRVTTRG